jgi:aminopeptidase N
MKHKIGFTSLVFLFLTTFSVAQIAPNISHLEELAKAKQKVYEKTLNKSKSIQGNNIDITYALIKWNVYPDTFYISGSIKYVYYTLEDTTTSFTLDMSSFLQVDTLIYHNKAGVFTHSNDVLTIFTDTLTGIGVKDSIFLLYQGMPTATGTGFGAFVRDQHDTTDVIWTLSEPYGSNVWWPCKDNLTDKIDSIDICVQAPSGTIAVSNGTYVKEVATCSFAEHYFSHRYPIVPYLVSVAVTNYARYDQNIPINGDTLLVQNYFYPEDLSANKAAVDDLVPVYTLYDSLFGPYPFMDEKYGHAQFGWGGGMEHQTISFIANFSFEVLSHELAHQWFGDMVTTNSWQHIWLNEAFATYATALCYENLFGGVWWPVWKELRVNHITSQPDGSVFVSDTTDVNRIFDGRLSYNKAAYVLHMIRWVIGDNAFFTSLRDYLTDPQTTYGFGTTEILKSYFESNGSTNLDDFFDDWFYGEGFPSYVLQWNRNAGTSVDFTLDQTSSHASVGFFEMPVPILFKNATQDTILVFNHTYSGESFTANPGFMADSLIFDPDLWILSNNNVVLGVNEKIETAFTLFPNPANNILHISFDSPSLSANKYLIYDAKGSLIQHHKSNTNNKQIQIDVSSLAKGVYSIVLLNGSEFFGTKRFEIIR